jgi:hypothetical protein
MLRRSLPRMHQLSALHLCVQVVDEIERNFRVVRASAAGAAATATSTAVAADRGLPVDGDGERVRVRVLAGLTREPRRPGREPYDRYG